MNNDQVLILRTCKADMTSSHGFKWPEHGPVKCDDWNPEPVCGGGLHGLLWGEGDGSQLNWSPDAKWLVVAVDSNKFVEINDKVKFPSGEVVFCGDRKNATDFIISNGGKGCVGADISAGNWGTATVGYMGTATVGYRGTATAGRMGTATAGNEGIATAGNWGTATAGDGGIATVGNEGIAAVGYRGIATAGDWGTATAGYDGTAIVGNRGIATAGNEGTVTAGDWGTIIISWHDGSRDRISVGYVGEDGIEPNTAYVVENGKLTKKEEEI